MKDVLEITTDSCSTCTCIFILRYEMGSLTSHLTKKHRHECVDYHRRNRGSFGTERVGINDVAFILQVQDNFSAKLFSRKRKISTTWWRSQQWSYAIAAIKPRRWQSEGFWLPPKAYKWDASAPLSSVSHRCTGYFEAAPLDELLLLVISVVRNFADVRHKIIK